MTEPLVLDLSGCTTIDGLCETTEVVPAQAPVRWVKDSEAKMRLQYARTITTYRSGSPVSRYIQWLDIPIVEATGDETGNR